MNKSIVHCRDLHEKTTEIIQIEEPEIYDATHVLTNQDLKKLTKAMMKAAKRLHPNNEMQRFDITGRPRFALPHVIS